MRAVGRLLLAYTLLTYGGGVEELRGEDFDSRRGRICRLDKLNVYRLLSKSARLERRIPI